MTAHDKPLLQSATDISLGKLLGTLDNAKEMPLVFTYDGGRIRGGYHVTEVKAGQFAALDCGANPEAWTEIFVQLWDIDEDGRTHMPSGKFSAITRKVSEHVSLESSARLTFEVSDGVQPMRLYCADSPTVSGDTLEVRLAPRAASCKPRDRWLAQQTTKADGSCCGEQKTSSCCT